MESGGLRHGSESQDSDDPAPTGALGIEEKSVDSSSTSSPIQQVSSIGVKNAKKKLRAFSIQKKTPITPVQAAKPIPTGNATVLIGKLSSVKVTPKAEKPDDDSKKPPKPPKPGGSRRLLIESYTELQRRTMSEIDDMKRKMELVELGIPLGLICPSTNALPVKAMPTKAMPPIKTFLDSEKVDAIIREAKKAKAEGKEFKFDYQKFVPDYDNPFQRKKEVSEQTQERPEIKETVLEKKEEDPRKFKIDKDVYIDRRKSEIYDKKPEYKRDDRLKFKDRFEANTRKEDIRRKEKEEKSRDRDDRCKEREKIREKDDKRKRDDMAENRKEAEFFKSSRKDDKRPLKKSEDKETIETKETNVNLSDFLVCDSWSLDTDDKNSPQVDKTKKPILSNIDPLDQLRQSLGKKGNSNSSSPKVNSPKPKIEKLQPVIDSFKFEIDPNDDDEVLDIFDEDSNLKKFSTRTNPNKRGSAYDSPLRPKYDFERDISNDDLNEDTFLESVINEIKLENMSDDETHEKGLVEYDESPIKDSEVPSVGSVTPELDGRYRSQSQRSDYSDGYRSTDSRKSVESGYKSSESALKSIRSNYEAAESYKSGDNRYISGDKSLEFDDNRYKSVDSSYKSDGNSYKSSDNKYKSGNNSSKSGSKSYKSGDNSYKSDDNSYKPGDNNYKSDSNSISYKSDDNSYKSDSNSRKSSDNSYKTDYNSCKSDENTYKSGESSLIYTETSYKTQSISKSLRLSVEKDLDEDVDPNMSKDTMDSLETWSFVLKICQPLLFRHDKNKCYKETHTCPKLWYTQNPKLCNCVKDRSVVYEELEMCKMGLVDRLYGCDQISDTPTVATRTWYPRIEQCVAENPNPVDMSTDWDIEESHTDPPKTKTQRLPMTPEKIEEVSLDREYQRFMEAVSWTDVSESKQDSRSTTPVRQESRKKKIERREDKKRPKKMKMSSDGWSQESEVEEEIVKPIKAEKVKVKRKRKHSTSTLTSGSEDEGKKRKKNTKKDNKKAKSKAAKRKRIEKKVLKTLKEAKKDKKKKKKTEKVEEDSDFEEEGKEVKKKEKKAKKKKQKVKKKSEKKKKQVESPTSSSSSSSSDSSSETDSESERKAKKKKKKEAEAKRKKKEKKKRHKESSSESHSEDLFDENILNNIKKERVEEERRRESSPAAKPREIINVKELHQEFSHNIQIKQEAEEESKRSEPAKRSEPVEPKVQPLEVPEVPKVPEIPSVPEVPKTPVVSKVPEPPKVPVVPQVPKIPPVPNVSEVPKVPEVPKAPKTAEVEPVALEVAEEVETEKETKEAKVVESEVDSIKRFELDNGNIEATCEKKEKIEFKEPENPTPPPRPDDTSQCSSQESNISLKDVPYEKDESHLRPSSQNSNYSFNDVMASSAAYKGMEDKFEGYENYEMYEQLAMAYQSDVASQISSQAGGAGASQRIETVVRARGEIKCDWRAGEGAGARAGEGGAPPAARPSRWGLKPGDVNIVLTGGAEGAEGGEGAAAAARGERPQVFRIQSIANRTDTNSMSYDEAYMDMYGAADKLQYGDCFAPSPPAPAPAPAPAPPAAPEAKTRSLDDRINKVLRDQERVEESKDENKNKESPDKGILVMKPDREGREGRGGKRVSFADGYRPGQDSDVEEPPVKKRARARRTGAAWPVAAAHPDHVALWDALPPPPPPPGSPPPPARAAPPLHLLRPYRPAKVGAARGKFDPSAALAHFMPPEPPPGLISFT